MGAQGGVISSRVGRSSGTNPPNATPLSNHGPLSGGRQGG